MSCEAGEEVLIWMEQLESATTGLKVFMHFMHAGHGKWLWFSVLAQGAAMAGAPVLRGQAKSSSSYFCAYGFGTSLL